ncbi:MAG: type II and III secretion system protein [Fibrobacter sp.]|nr:type II and III secretion system protein [Fibrobacter sp.]
MTLDFVDTPVQDVARSLSLAYDVPVMVDAAVDGRRVTFHLDGVSLLEGLSALCESNGLELVQKENLLVIQPRRHRGKSDILFQDTLVSVQVQDKDVLEFLEEYSATTGLNILWNPDVQGRVSGSIRSLPSEQAFRSLMEINGFVVQKKNGCLMVRTSAPPSGTDSRGTLQTAPKIWKDGELYEAHLDGIPMGEALKELASLAGLNLALYGNLEEKVRLDFTEVNLQDFLQSLFRGSRYSFQLDSNTLSVSEGGSRNPLSTTELYLLKHVQCEKAMLQLGKMFSGGELTVSEVKEQNGILLSGTADRIQTAVSLLQKIDVPLMQVTLSCVIVEFKKGKAFEIGLRGGTGRRTKEGDLGLKGFLDFLGKDASGKGAVGKIGILPDRFEMELASMEENNQAKVLARPRLTTLNGNKAELNVTNTVYYLVSQVSAEGYPITDYRSFNDGISLELTPSVTREGVITLDVAPEIKTAGRSSGDGPRDISTRNLKTMVLLKNGETLCLGGLVRKNRTEVRTAVPFLGSIPFIGRLFSYESEEEEESELAIFITPEVKF